jgi:phosphoenolpyruvate-protein phosphotransferase (PTS system enzyme I)
MDAPRQELMKGIAVSPGIVRAPAFVAGDAAHLSVPRRTISEPEVGAELAKLESALHEAEEKLDALRADVCAKIGPREAGIFDAQMLLLRDPVFLNEVSTHVTTDRLNLEAALVDVIERFSQMFAQIADPCMRERAGDVRDVGRRVLAILQKQQPWETLDLPPGVIVVVPELAPSTTARLDLRGVRGIVTEQGGKTSHAAILMRSLRIPAVVAVPDATKRIQTGDPLILDGISGAVFVHPGEAVVQEYAGLEAEFRSHEMGLEAYLDQPAVTQDGMAIQLLANIGKSADAEAALRVRADGIGLFRTEFSFLVRDRAPTAEEHLAIYTEIAERLHPREVTIRVLDIGSDKTPAYLQLAKDANPALSLRGTRLLLAHRELLEPQLRAILQVSALHPVSVLFPGIGGVEDILEAKKVIEDVKTRLREEGRAFNPGLRVGAMIEIPSAAIMARHIAREVDFLSIGTNDLTQHVLAADRGSTAMAPYYRALHPAVLRMIKATIDAGRAAGREVTICGQMAGNPARTALLIGLGARRLSVTPGEILEVKRALTSIDAQQAERLASAALEQATVQEIEALLNEAGTHAPAVAVPVPVSPATTVPG